MSRIYTCYIFVYVCLIIYIYIERERERESESEREREFFNNEHTPEKTKTERQTRPKTK